MEARPKPLRLGNAGYRHRALRPYSARPALGVRVPVGHGHCAAARRFSASRSSSARESMGGISQPGRAQATAPLARDTHA
jgi:hypothetical protein